MEGERIFLASPHMSDEGYELEYVNDAFRKNWVAPLGENVNEFEAAVKRFTGAENAVALSAGTAALHLALILAGVGRGDKVFCQSLTFSASANPIAYLGAEPVFVDSESESWNLDPAAVREAIRLHGAPKALVAVHLYGMPAKMREIEGICEEYGIVLVEDAAEALGSVYEGHPCGTLGQLGALSFNGNKIITTSGGGMLLCREKEDAAHALKLATQAREPFPWYQHEEIGYNYRMSNISAGIGRGQMRVLPERIAKKREIFETYKRELAEKPLSFQEGVKDSASNRWLTAATIADDCKVTPTELIRLLGEENIEARHVWKPMHMQPVFSDCAFVKCGDAAVSERLFNRGICLPSDTKMTPGEQMKVIETLKKAF